jgi:hypothetical protein
MKSRKLQKHKQTYKKPFNPYTRSSRYQGKWSYPGPRQCHPANKEIFGSSCLPKNILISASVKLGLSASTSFHALAKYLNVSPEDQRTFLYSLPFPKDQLYQYELKYLRPKQPDEWESDPDAWLDSNNIKDVMKQYELLYPEFLFLGPYPIDFASPDTDDIEGGGKGEKKCLINEMCTLDLDKKELEGKKYIGIIFNLDRHDQGGSHWVAAFINIPKDFCYYFDSYGREPPIQIYKFMQWLTLQEPKMKLGWNGVHFQRSNTECGMFSMYFIDRMLAKEPYLKFCRSSPSDAFMLRLRNWLFST